MFFREVSTELRKPWSTLLCTLPRCFFSSPKSDHPDCDHVDVFILIYEKLKIKGAQRKNNKRKKHQRATKINSEPEMKNTEKSPFFSGKNGDFYSTKYVADSEPKFGGLLGEKNWRVSQHNTCGRFRTKIWGTSAGEKLGIFTAWNLWEIRDWKDILTYSTNSSKRNLKFARFWLGPAI